MKKRTKKTEGPKSQSSPDPEKVRGQGIDTLRDERRTFAARFLRSVPIDSNTSRSHFFIPELNLEIDLSESVKQVEKRRIGEEFLLELIRKLPETRLDTTKPTQWELPTGIVREDGSHVEYTETDRQRDAAAKRDGVFESTIADERGLTYALFSIPSESSKVTAVIPERDLAKLKKGDVCEVYLTSTADVFAEASEERPLEVSAIFLRKKPKAGSVGIASVPATKLEPFADNWRASEDRFELSSAREILADITRVQDPIVRKLNAWLSSLEGKSFRCESAAQQLSEITSLVARAGCILIHDEQPVSLYATTPSDQKNATINVSTLGVRPQRTLLARTKFPPVTARPVDVATDFRQ